MEKHQLHSPAWILGQAHQEVLGRAEGRSMGSPVRDGELLSPSHSALPSEPLVGTPGSQPCSGL